MKIAVVGLGYVGLSNAILLAQSHEVIAVDVDASKVDDLNKRISPIDDTDIEHYLARKPLQLSATQYGGKAYVDANYIVVAVPTNYDVDTNSFNTSLIENVISDVLRVNKQATIVIKSTIPVGYTKKVRKQFDYDKIIFSPEFLLSSGSAINALERVFFALFRSCSISYFVIVMNFSLYFSRFFLQ